MKKIIKYFCLAAALMGGLASCEIDNLDAPDVTIKGTIYDHKGVPLQTENGKGNMKIRIRELSWKEKVVTPRELNVMMDGTYINTKQFPGTYLVHPYQGAFYPLDSTEMKTVELDGVTTVDFNVTPYLEIEWVTEPQIVTLAEGEHPDKKPAGQYFKASAKFKLVTKEGKTHPGVQFGRLFVSNTHFVADNNKISEYYNREDAVNNSKEGQVITFVSTQAVKYTGMTYYFRIGFKCNDADKKYNYTDVKTIVVP